MFSLRTVTLSNSLIAARSLAGRVLLSSSVTDVKETSKSNSRQLLEIKCRTNENNPCNHTQNHEGLFYTLPKEIQNKLFAVYNWKKETHELFNVMNETAIMIRSPALKLINEIKSLAPDQPLKRYLLHGRVGTGRSFTLTHLVHFGHRADFILVHMVSPNTITRFPQEKADSDYCPGRIDTPIDAALLLQHFKAQNAHLLNNLTVSKDYVWSLREKTSKGEPLINVVDHGINRMKHASDCYAVLLKELQVSADQGKCKVLVLIDKINLLYWATNVRHADLRYAETDELTVSRALKKMLRSNWKNGVLVGALDKYSRDEFEQNIGDKPSEILTEKGEEQLKPYKLVNVNNYSDKEFLTCLEYYNDRHFLSHPAIFTEAGREEVKFISAKNPLDLYSFCRSI